MRVDPRELRGTAWRRMPTSYIVAKSDRSVHPDLRRFLASRMGARTYELESNHCPMLSQSDAVLEVIRAAANAIRGAMLLP